MGVRGLQGFVENACPGARVEVSLRDVAEEYRSSHPGRTPVLVVDAPGCLRHWYSPESWVCGGQWREYLSVLRDFIEAFTAAGIKLVFFFDGVVEQTKRNEWVKRRLKNDKEIARIFQAIKRDGQQPGRAMFFLPSGLATFTRFALKSLGQDTLCSVREADYEVAAFGLQNDCLGILGEDTDYLIYSTCPYFSVRNLRLDRLTTVMFSRDQLCRRLGLRRTDLPLLACLLGNDTVPEDSCAALRERCLASRSCPAQPAADGRSATVLAVAAFISGVLRGQQGARDLGAMIPSGPDPSLLCRGVTSYLLPGQDSPWLLQGPDWATAEAEGRAALCPDPEILQVAKERHIRAENYLAYNVLSCGEVECSNTLEDALDAELPGQALVYRPARQRLYWVLLGAGRDPCEARPAVKEWFVHAGNPLRHPELVQPVQPDLPGGTPSLKTLWLVQEPGARAQRYSTFLACFGLPTMAPEAEELQALEGSLAATCCLLSYLLLQVGSLSLEDLNAFIAQTLCLRGKSAAQLAGLQPAYVDSRAVHLGSLFIRGLTTLVLANSTCGCPFCMDDLMPWQVFDGKLFQQKYQQSHSGRSPDELLEGNKRWQTEFQNLTSLICRTCNLKNRTVLSRQRGVVFNKGGQERMWESQAQLSRQHHSAPPRHRPDRSLPWRGPLPSPAGSPALHSGRGFWSEERGQRRKRFPFAPRDIPAHHRSLTSGGVILDPRDRNSSGTGGGDDN
ncbi:constitutive coactivator of peroxisome proliferator-activated receptor gamma isoform X1 [Tachyglossus aculeatus]|uniref:constitutive coactivator of peroxisome proliferator-activated receptor gamma isoform X1 n=1 Tax=Tachyglossus aculeatus TaxID=9261 RepID=UPI0018F74AC0|nr:constitutive coactivator of peroxisome proliferator-activated receptor gamma isoform X1 [Tachyglossus aculeatus]